VDEGIWLEEFQNRAGRRLRVMFEDDLNGMPQFIVEKIEELRKQEKAA
jgi:hypothetical protein